MTAKVAVLLGLCGVLLLGTAWLGARGRLRRNKVVGIRVPSTLRSDAAWAAAHRAAAVPFGAAGAAAVAGAVAAVLVAEDDVPAVALPVLVVIVGSLAVAAVRGQRAARGVPDDDTTEPRDSGPSRGSGTSSGY